MTIPKTVQAMLAARAAVPSSTGARWVRCDRCQRLLPPELFGRRGSVCEECHAESRKRKAVRCLEIVRAKTKRILREQEIREARARQAAGEREE